MKQIKENLKGFCFTCKVRMIIPTWKYCQSCDQDAKQEKKRRRKLLDKFLLRLTFDDYQDVLKLYTLSDNIKNKNLHDKKILVYDENNVIIGYK